MSGLAPPEGPGAFEVPGAALPTVVIGGYLGAGKTTLVNRLLREAAARGAGEGGRRIAVLVNDFGEVSIDADLIVGAEGGVLSLAGGCVCCSFGADLVGALAQVAARQPPPHVVLVETSGVGLPGAVARTAALAPQVRVEQIVVVADAAAVRAQAAARYVGGTVRRQLQEADLVLLGKVDLVQPQEVRELETWLRNEVGVAVPGVAMPPPGSEGAEDLAGLADLVLGPAAGSPAAGGTAGEGVPAPTPGRAEPARRVPLAAGFAPRPLRPEAEPAAQRFVTTTLRFDRAVDTAALGAELLAQGVLRAKGVLLDLAGGWQEVQVAGGRVHRRPAAAPPAVVRHRGDGRDGGHGRGDGASDGASDGGDGAGGDGGNGTHDAAEAAGRLVAISLRHG